MIMSRLVDSDVSTAGEQQQRGKRVRKGAVAKKSGGLVL